MKTSVFFGAVMSACAAIAIAGIPHGPEPLTDDQFDAVDQKLADLGHVLFFDPILSGNKNIACATCHHPTLGTSDAMSLSFGEGATGLGGDRLTSTDNTPVQRIPRNAPALFNLGVKDMTALFHDGRVEIDETAAFGIRMPEGRELEREVPNILAAQAMLPILSADEMAGHHGENPIAAAVAADNIRGPSGAWDLIAKRVENIDQYQQAFAEITGRENIHITDISTALSAFIADEFRANNSPADQSTRGEVKLSAEAENGAALFYGKAGCVACHNGPMMTDGDFHAIALPQIGPGKMQGESYYRDVGRFAVTGDPNDMYKFRTPTLRNVTLTAPYGHNGAFFNLEDMVRHHLDPIASLLAYTPDFARLSADFDVGDKEDFAAMNDPKEIAAIAAANELPVIEHTDEDIQALVAFLEALTDENALSSKRGVPETVPSGLSIDIVD